MTEYTPPRDGRKSTTKTIETLGPYDILFGRNKPALNNVGNRRFRVIIKLNLQAYLTAKSKSEKSELIKSITLFLRNDAGARFLKVSKDAGYVELGEQKARRKVGRALRDMAVSRHHLTMKEWTQNLNSEEDRKVVPVESSNPLKGPPEMLTRPIESARTENEPIPSLERGFQLIEWSLPESESDGSSTCGSFDSFLTEGLPDEGVISDSLFDDNMW